jgi:hypothetical protein
MSMEATMTRTRYQPPLIETPDPVPGQTQLPIHKPVANYYRQSTAAQVGNISTEMQTIDMTAYLRRLGWQDEQIYMIDMDQGVSGTKKIDEREGMKHLFDLITTDQIGAVACQDEDRLFRDVTQIQVNIFIEACRVHHVLVITPSVHYDFAHPLHGVFHARQFRFKSEMAADYINSVIMGRLHNARRKLSLAGMWAGSPMPAGLMVDMRKKLDSGALNPNYRKYVEFTPFAEVVREYFNLFIAHNGCRSTTLRHIREHGPYFPDPKLCLPPDGFKTVYRLRLQKNGRFYVDSSISLGWMMANALYIGHWVHNRTVLIWNNHEAIIDPSLFYKTFNYLSPYDLSGDENGDYKPMRSYARRTYEADREQAKPLCTGLMFSYLNGKLKRVGTQWRNNVDFYCYTLNEYDSEVIRLWSRRADPLDAAVSALFVEKLKATFTHDQWNSEIDARVSIHQKQHEAQRKQLEHLQTVMGNLLTSLETLSNPQMIASVERRYQEAQSEYERLQQEISEGVVERLDVTKLLQIKKHYTQAIHNWDTWDADKKRAILHVFIHQIIATPGENLSLHLEIRWNDTSKNEITLASTARHAMQWTQEDVARLVALGQANEDPITIASQFPDRTWRGLRWKYHSVTGESLPYASQYQLLPVDTYHSYLEREGASYRVSTDKGTKWAPEEVEDLIGLGKAQQDPVTIAARFPDRKWRAIRWKYLTATGDSLPHAAQGEMLPEETYHAYLERIGGQTGVNNRDTNAARLEDDSARDSWP